MMYNNAKGFLPCMQALTLSTNLTSTEKSRSKPDAGYVSRDGEQSFTSRTMRYIKAAHQLNSSPGMTSDCISCVNSLRSKALGQAKSIELCMQVLILPGM